MRSFPQCTSPSVPPQPVPPSPRPASVFTPTFLDRLEDRHGDTTVPEAEYAGPWTTVELPGRPGEVGVMRAWESPEKGDAPRGAFRSEEAARLVAVALPLVGRAPRHHLAMTTDDPEVPGYPVVGLEGEAGPEVCGWLALYEPQVLAALHVLQGLVRSPVALAAVLETAGAGVLAQVDRLLGRRLAG